jgi:shikimate dehydrogenase
MKKFGLIGFPLEHSFSKAYFSEKFKKEDILDCQYDNFPLKSIELLRNIIENNDLAGLNVTIPYKQSVIKFLDEIDDEAKEIGAVNTLKIIQKSNKTIVKGYNTDVYGFEKPLLQVLKKHHKKALILGTGGASKAVAYVLNKHNIEYQYVSRNPKKTDILSYSDLSDEILAQYQIIVNTSPIGMYPNIGEKPDIPYEGIGEQHILYDLVYNPVETLFLKEGKQKKSTIINGLPMLYEQANKSWEIWNS